MFWGQADFLVLEIWAGFVCAFGSVFLVIKIGMSSLPLRAGVVHEITKRHSREIHNTVSSPTMELIHVSHSGENLGLTSVSYTFRSQVSSPSIATSSANRQLMMLEGKSGPYFSSLDSSIEILKKRAQELIENINESRQKDHALMTNFRDSLKIKVTRFLYTLQNPSGWGRESPYVKGEG